MYSRLPRSMLQPSPAPRVCNARGNAATHLKKGALFMISLSKHLRLATRCAALAVLIAAPVAANDGHGNSDVAHSKSGPGNTSDAAAANANSNANLGVGASNDHGGASGVFLGAITPQATGSTSALV